MTRHVPRILWIGDRRRDDVRPPAGGASLGEASLGEADRAGGDADLLVIESPECGSSEQCRELCERLDGPVLLLVEPEQLAAAAQWLPPRHDLASLDDPPRLLQFRIARLLLGLQWQLDGLTGAYNRRQLDRKLAGLFREPEPVELSVALLDLDHFGAVNKRHGWPSGDKVLRETCELIGRQLGERDWLARYGGDEFCVVMPGAPAERAGELLERIRQAVAEHAFTSTAGAAIPLAISGGAATRQSEDRTAGELLERASAALLRVKG